MDTSKLFLSLLTLTLLAQTSCAGVLPPTQLSSPNPLRQKIELPEHEIPLQISLLISHSFEPSTEAAQPEFEQYFIKNKVVLAEWGEIRRGRFISREHSILEIDAAQYDATYAALIKAIDSINQSGAELPYPVSESAQKNSGQLEILVAFSNENIAVKIPVHSMGALKANPASPLTSLVQLIRNLRATPHA